MYRLEYKLINSINVKHKLVEKITHLKFQHYLNMELMHRLNIKIK